LICFLYGLHIVSINRTLPINNNTQMSCSLILYCFFSIIYYSLYFITIYILIVTIITSANTSVIVPVHIF